MSAASVRATLLGLTLVAGLAGLAGCRHRGAAWSQPAPPVTGEVEIFVIGQPREAASTRAVARELDRALARSSAAGRTSVIAWLGTDFGASGPDAARRCPDPTTAYQSPNLAALARVVTDAVARGATAWGLPGPDGWRCHLHGFDARAMLLPFHQPGVAYVVRVHRGGEVELASSCELRACTVTPASDDTLVELVALDFSFWHYPELGPERGPSDLDQSLLDQQAALLAALAQQPPRPRLLLSPIPVESAGAHGLGGRKQRTAFHYLPAFVQQALADGLFVGVLGALERDLQVSEDLSNAIVRSDRTFVARPIFGVVSGAAGGAGHTLPTSRGVSLLPDLHSEHPGFARLSITDAHVELRVHARVAGRWQVAAIELPLRPEPLPAVREPPTIMPCPGCDPRSGAGDREVFGPRNQRPR